MINATNVNSQIQRNILGGAKIPHSVSQPVIYKEEGKYYLAVFVFFYTKEDIQSGMVNRPTAWAKLDIKSGEIIEEYQCKDKDFSDARYDVKYNVRSDIKYDTSKAYYDEAFEILDSVRREIIETDTIDKLKYNYYLKKIINNIPEAYQRFYLDLSVEI